jgi:hypothetical protein
MWEGLIFMVRYITHERLCGTFLRIRRALNRETCGRIALFVR